LTFARTNKTRPYFWGGFCYGPLCYTLAASMAVTHHIKLEYIPGLRDIVLAELAQYPHLEVAGTRGSAVYLSADADPAAATALRSVWRASLVARDGRYTPRYLANHKAVVGELVTSVIERAPANTFRTFAISCAGADSAEVRSIARYIEERFRLEETREADLKLAIGKSDGSWEVGVQLTSRPLSLRDYKVVSMPGAMDPTIAYAVNSLCELEHAGSYLNVFSGSGTLLIEAARWYPHLSHLVGIENDKQAVLAAVQNMKAAGVMGRAAIDESDVCSGPALGTFDAITADLPFGMSIGKGNDLERTYRCFAEYCERSLANGGVMAAYTTERDMLHRALNGLRFSVERTIPITLATADGDHIHPAIIVCR